MQFDDAVSVLLGGGVESTALVDLILAEGEQVIPVHVSCGLAWDDAELNAVQRFLDARKCPRLGPLIEIRISLAGFLNDHWAVQRTEAPTETLPYGSLEIPHRNMLLLGLAVHRLPKSRRMRLATGTTAENNFSDGSRLYFDRCADVLSLEMERPVTILTPFISLTKTDVIRLSSRETLAMSFSCVSPVNGGHCGTCIKCRKKKQAFIAASVDDPTRYAH
jgi:7-cyano-7-deazaguanine synthase